MVGDGYCGRSSTLMMSLQVVYSVRLLYFRRPSGALPMCSTVWLSFP